MNSKIIIVTGSYGKTSTKTILESFLSTKYKTIASPSSYNTCLGLSKFINGITDEKEILILEAGAKKIGDIAKICKIFKPDYAIITGVTSQHLETFGTLQNVISTKGEVLDYLSKNSICVLNADDNNSMSYFLRGKSILSVGKNGKDYRYKNIEISPTGTKFSIEFNGNTIDISTILLGEMAVKNITLAFALANKLGCTPHELICVAKTLSYVPHRMELIKNGNIFILDDSYNANQLGAEGFLEVLNVFSSTRSVISQGIVEGGKNSFLLNYGFAKKMAQVVDYCAILGENTHILYKGLIDGGKSKEKIFICKTVDEAVEKLLQKTEKDGVIAFQNDLPDNMASGYRRLK